MKNQITKNVWTKMLGVVLMLMVSTTTYAQFGGPGPGGQGQGGPGGGHGHGHGGPGGGHPHQPCDAHFKSKRDSVVNGIRFDNYSGTGAATYAWDFGDGSTGTGADPSHTYAAQGTY